MGPNTFDNIPETGVTLLSQCFVSVVFVRYALHNAAYLIRKHACAHTSIKGYAYNVKYYSFTPATTTSYIFSTCDAVLHRSSRLHVRMRILNKLV